MTIAKMSALWRWFFTICGTVVAVIGWNFLVLANLLSWTFGAQFPQMAFWVLFTISMPAFFAIAHHYFFKT